MNLTLRPATVKPAPAATMTDPEFRAWKRGQSPPDEWSMGFSATSLLTTLVLARINEGQPERDAVAAVWVPTESEFRADVLGYLAGFGAECFGDWIRSCLAGSPLPRAAADLGPTWDAPYTPTAADLAEYESWLDSRHGDDHDGQFDPNDLLYWTLSESEYFDAEHDAWVADRELSGC